MKGPCLLRILLPSMVLGWKALEMLPAASILIEASIAVAFLAAATRALISTSHFHQVRIATVVLGVALGMSFDLLNRLKMEHISNSEMTEWRRVELEVLKNNGMFQGDFRSVSRIRRGGQVLVSSPMPLQPGYAVRGLVRCHCLEGPQFPGGFDARSYYQGKGISRHCHLYPLDSVFPAEGLPGRCRRWLHALQHDIESRFDRMESGTPRGLLLALATGDRSGMSFQAKRSFANVGLAHLTAVSGFHTGMVAGFVLLVLRAMGLRRRRHPWLLIPVIWIYVGLCGFPESAVRAASMATMLAMGMMLQRRPDGIAALSFVGIAMWSVAPHAANDVGVQLSFLATAGILLLHESIKASGLPKHQARILMLFAVPFVATAFTAPVAWPSFGKVPTGFLPANLVATPVVTALVICTAIWIAFPAGIADFFGEALLVSAHWLVSLVEWAVVHCKPFLLPLNGGAASAAGTSLALSVFLAMKRRKPGVYLMAGTLTAWLIIDCQFIRERQPSVHAIRGQLLCFNGRSWGVFMDHPTSQMKWETRSFLERVSQVDPDSVHWCGDRLAKSTSYIRFRGRDGQWELVNLPRSRCE